MRMSILGFALGIWLAQQQAVLPGWAALAKLAAAAALALAVAFLLRRRILARPLLWMGAAAAGFLWAAGFGQLRLADALAAENEGRDLTVVGVVAGLPQPFENGSRFDFTVESAPAGVPARLSVAWYYQGRHGEEGEAGAAAPSVHAGERWQLSLRLKRPHGNLNPHGFDYEAWLFERGVRATGYVRNGPGNRRLAEFVPRFDTAVEGLREAVRGRFLAALPAHDYAGVLVALAVGDQRAIDAELWQAFARTGTTHLMSISGLHVTMVAGLAGWLVFAFWRRRPALALRLPAQKAAAAGGWAAAGAYALLAGFGVPAQRTFYMLSVAATALWAGRTASASRVLCLALLVVLLADPWAVLSAGFWLSFGAVALLFYIGAGRVGTGHWLAEWGRAQWAVTVGMVPALLALFQQFSLVSPLANAVAIPVVSLVVTPLALVAAVLPLDALLALAHLILAALMALLEWLAGVPAAVWQQHAPPAWAVALASLGGAWLLLPRGFPARWCGTFLFAPLILAAPERPAPGELRLTVLDVGQGLAVHAQTAGHDLLYDTGPQFSPDADSGNRIIVPYLRALGVRRLDALVLTHEDKDHSGGAQSVLDALPVAWIASSLPPEHPLWDERAHVPCADGQGWDWDGVRFEMLHPPPAQGQRARKTNDLSCVLKVSGAGGTVLLTADIEAVSEAALLTRHGPQLAADILLAPHHGSRTSSTPEFLAAVAAKTVVFPVGYRNRFRHPNGEVLRRHEAGGARLLRTDRDGAVSFRLAPGGVLVELEREARKRYWHGQ